MNPHETSQMPGLHSTHPSVSNNLTHSIPHFPTPRMHLLLPPETPQGHDLNSIHGTVATSLGHCIPQAQLPTSRMNTQPQETSNLFSLHSTHTPQATLSSSLSHNIQQIPTQRLNPQDSPHIQSLHTPLPSIAGSLSVPQLHVPTPRMNLPIPEVLQSPNLHHMSMSAPDLGTSLSQTIECVEPKPSPPHPAGGDAPIQTVEKKLKKKKKGKKVELEEKLTQKGKLRKIPTKITPEVLVIINRIISYFEVEKRIQQPCYAWRCVNSRVAKAVGISPRTVRKIRLREQNGPVPSKPRKKSTGRPPTLSEAELNDIQNTIEAMAHAKEVIKVDTVKAKLDRTGLTIARTTLYNTLKKMGFRYTQKTGKKKPKPEVIGWSRIMQDVASHKVNAPKVRVSPHKTQTIGDCKKPVQRTEELAPPLRMDTGEEIGWLCMRDIETGEQQVQTNDGQGGKMLLSKEEENFIRQIMYFELEKASQQPLYAWRCVNSRVAQATGLSPRTIQRIREAEKNRPPGQPIVKKIKKKSTGRPSTLKASDRFHISSTLDAMQRSKEPVTLAKLKTRLDSSGLVISRSTLARIIQKMGFHYTPAKSEKGKTQEEREKNEERGSWSRDQAAKEQWEKEIHQRLKQQAEVEAVLSRAVQHGNAQHQHIQQQQHHQQQHQHQVRNNQQSTMHAQGGGTGRMELDDDQHGYLREFGHEEDSVDGASDRSDEVQLGNFLREFGQEAVTTAYGAGGGHS